MNKYLLNISLTLLGVAVLIAALIIGLLLLFVFGVIVTSKYFACFIIIFVIVYGGYYIGQSIKHHFSDKRNVK